MWQAKGNCSDFAPRHSLIFARSAPASVFLQLIHKNPFLVSERIGAKLEVQDLARRSPSAFCMKRCSRAVGSPEPLSFPAGFRIINPPVHPFCIEYHRTRHAQDHEFAAIVPEADESVVSVT